MSFQRCVAPKSLNRFVLFAVVFSTLITLSAFPAQAAITWDGEGVSTWWFDPANWSESASNGGLGLLPPSDEGFLGALEQDAQINRHTYADFDRNGNVGGLDFLTLQRNFDKSGFFEDGDLTDDGLVDGEDYERWEDQYGISHSGADVVYDPDNDPFFANAGTFPYPTGSPAMPYVGTDYGPQHIYRFYMARKTTNQVQLTIKSGDLVIADSTIIGRSGSDGSHDNLARVLQTGGRVRIPLESLNLGRREEAPFGLGNGEWEYRGGILDVASDGGDGIRLSTGSVSGEGTGGYGRFIMGNPDPNAGGYVRTYDYWAATDGINGDGVTSGVGYSEFVYENGGTRPIQVTNDLRINNGLDDSDGMGIRSSRLVLSLEEAPAVDPNGVPSILGLFQIDGIITGVGDLGNFFSNEDNTLLYTEGEIVSAEFGGTTYNWTITYTGNITWIDADNSVIDTITGAGTGNDVVLVGLSSALTPVVSAVPEPTTLILVLCCSGWTLLARRDRSQQS